MRSIPVTPVPTSRPRFSRAASLLAVVLASAFTALAVAYPKPATIPFRWEMDLASGALRLYMDPIDQKPYWYFTYTLTNKSGKDRIWAPSFVLFTDAGEILTSGKGVPSRIEESVRDLLANPLLETQKEIIGDVLQGKEHARDGLVVWPARTLDVDHLSLFVGGLSGETARVKNPVTGETTILRKTLQRDYLIRGDARARGTKPIELLGETWVLR